MTETSVMEEVLRVPEARYAYYRRCQVFRKGGEQCKAPAEKGSHICYAHAGQLATAVRRERERRAVLEEAVAQMRKRGRPECEMADLFMDFKGINMTLAVMAQAVIAGRIDCKTAGRLLVQLQTVSKLLWLYHRGHRGTQRTAALTTKDTRSTPLSQAQGRSGQAAEPEGRKNLPLINADDTDLRELREEPKRTAEARRCGEQPRKERDWAGNHTASNHVDASYLAANQREATRIALVAKMMAVGDRRSWAHAPPELLRAA
jgi:hypothetical protein